MEDREFLMIPGPVSVDDEMRAGIELYMTDSSFGSIGPHSRLLSAEMFLRLYYRPIRLRGMLRRLLFGWTTLESGICWHYGLP